MIGKAVGSLCTENFLNGRLDLLDHLWDLLEGCLHLLRPLQLQLWAISHRPLPIGIEPDGPLGVSLAKRTVNSTGKVCTRQLSGGQICAGQVGFCEVRAAKIGSRQVRAKESSARQI